MAKQYDLMDVLDGIDPRKCTYQEWCSVGMALKQEGYTVDAWDDWSRRDGDRFHPCECADKWATFQGSSSPVSGGTLVQLARAQGWTPPGEIGYELDFDSIIGGNDSVVVQPGWIEEEEIHEPSTWNAASELARYLELLFEAGENVGYVTQSWQKDDKHMPTKGCWDRSAGELIQLLNRCKDGDIGSVLGDYNPEAGAWIRFNPLDGTGCKNENVTEYRYALVESDSMPIGQQYAIIKQMELPVAVLVHSGKKSLHAIVRIEAQDYTEYRKRVDYLYTVCQKNGLQVDGQNKNPSRLSRMPGAVRNGHKQFIVAENIGKASWNEWQDWIEGVNDNLPEPESMASAWNNLPPLAEPLIEGILRKGHKMLIAGPSKAGKSYALIELCIAIAEGKQWMGLQCAKGRVMYVNLELDRASCLHRFKDVYEALGWDPVSADRIDIWNLRGKALPMDKLAPRLIRRAMKKNYIAIVIDPIYKVITGDENSADQMAKFCNQFDLVCNELGCAVIYCHHHSKGAQGGKKSMDRASGSGVFARDPDALLDMIELIPSDELVEQEREKAAIEGVLDALHEKVVEEMPDGISANLGRLMSYCKDHLPMLSFRLMADQVEEDKARISRRTAWRIDGTLREFPNMPPVDVWFDYPIHHVDSAGALRDAEVDGELPAWQKAVEKHKENAANDKANRLDKIAIAVDMCTDDTGPTVKKLAEYFSVTPKTITRWLKEIEYAYFVDRNDGLIKRNENVSE